MRSSDSRRSRRCSGRSVAGATRSARHGAVSVAALALSLGALMPAATAGVGPDELDLDGAVQMSSAELDGSRGGFALGSFLVNLGIQITTTVNNAVSVQTVLTMDPTTLAANITSNVTAGVAATTAAANAGIAAAHSAIAAAAAPIVVALTVPQVVVAAVAGNGGNNNGTQTGSGINTGNQKQIPIPVAGAVIGDIQDAVAHSPLSGFVPGASGPATTTSQPVETAQQLADLVLGGVPSRQDAAAFAAGQATTAANAAASAASASSTAADAAANGQAATATASPNITVTQLRNGMIFDVGGTLITHQIRNGILASIQNSIDNTQIAQTVQVNVDVANLRSAMQGALAAMAASKFNAEIARFGATLGS